MSSLELAQIVVKVIQQGSFSKAAQVLRLPKSTVSKAVSRLESETGTKLLIRTTRSLTVTAAGRAFYDSCVTPLQSLEDALKSLQGQDSILSGSLRLTAPEDLGVHVLSKALAQLTKKHPGLAFDLNYTDKVVDLVKDGYDLAIRLGKLSESSFKTKKIGVVRLVPVVAPAYLKKIGKIAQPGDLSKCDCLSLSLPTLLHSWVLSSNKSTIRVPVRCRLSSNQMTSLVKMCVEGAGVAFVPQYLCLQELASGALERLLPGWSGTAYPVSIVSPLASGSSVRLKITIDHLSEAISKAIG